MATKEALAEEKKRNVKQYILALRKVRDSDIIERLESMDNKNGYIKTLIRADMASADSVEKEEKKGFSKREKKLISDYISNLIDKDIKEEEEEK